MDKRHNHVLREVVVMAEYTKTLSSFTLQSKWTCGVKTSVGNKPSTSTFVILVPPDEGSAAKEFAVSLPTDAVISRAWVTAGLGSPNSGAAYIRLNGANFRSGELDVEGITPLTTTFTATFTFKANGAIYNDQKQHSGSLAIYDPTLHIEYTSDSSGGDSGGGSGGSGGDDSGDIEMVPLPDETHGRVTGGDKPGRKPRLLGENLRREVTRFDPIRVSLDMTLKPLSTAVVTLPWGETEVKVRDFLELFSPDGSAGVFRVSEVENTYGEQQKIYCEEALCTLSDSIAVGVQAMSGTFRQVVAGILAAQSVERWVLGDVDLPDEYEVVYEHTYDTLYNAIMDLTEMLPEGYAWVRDTTSYPFTMSLKKLDDSDRCEARLNRNLEAVHVSLDASSMCTRVFPFGAGEGTDRINLATLSSVNALYLDADTVETWGVVAKSFVDEDIADSLTLKNVAELYLEKHKDPVVSISLDALALYAATGLSIDRFRLGLLCRLPLPAYGVTMNERVVAVSYPDVYGTPRKATVTLANRVNTVSDELGSLLRTATQSKLIGGKVKDTEYTNEANDLAHDDGLVCYFEITEYGNLLGAKIVYSLTSGGVKSAATVTVDGNQLPDTDPGVSVDIMAYLEKDESGVVKTGQHKAYINPKGDDYYYGTATVTVKTIEKE